MQFPLLTIHLGRCQTKSDLKMTFDVLCGLAKNPNVGGVVIIDHFREELCNIDDMAHEISKTGKLIETVNIRDAGGVLNATAEATRKAMYITRELSTGLGIFVTVIFYIVFGVFFNVPLPKGIIIEALR